MFLLKNVRFCSFLRFQIDIFRGLGLVSITQKNSLQGEALWPTVFGFFVDLIGSVVSE